MLAGRGSRQAELDWVFADAKDDGDGSGRAFGRESREILAHEVTAWQDHRNKHHAKADWQFTTANTRVKLKRLYPQFE